jgi:hypothetical protein
MIYIIVYCIHTSIDVTGINDVCINIYQVSSIYNMIYIIVYFIQQVQVLMLPVTGINDVCMYQVSTTN